MNRLLKCIATLSVVVILLGIITAVLLPRIIDPNDYRDDIAKLVHDNYGLTLSIDGPVGWSIFPGLVCLLMMSRLRESTLQHWHIWGRQKSASNCFHC